MKRSLPFLALAITVVPAVLTAQQMKPAPALPVPAGQAAGTPEQAIIPDSQFDKALPPIDPALTVPLDPVTSIDLPPDRAASPGAAAAPVSTPAAVAPDPALSQPLPPLATFDVEPPAAVARTGEQAPDIRYAVQTEGFGATGLEGRFRSLSALEDGKGKAQNGAVIAARAHEDEALALRLLRSEGYYDAVASSLVEPAADQAGRITATISVSPGARYALGAIAIDGPDTIPPGLARAALALHTGDPIVAPAIEGAEAAITLKLPQRGYPFVTVGARDIVLDDVTHRGDYTLPVDPGPRSSFGTYSTTGRLAFSAAHIGVLARFRPGELYDERRVNDLREAMVATGLFDSVAIQPRRTNGTAPDGTEIVDLLVTQNAGKPRRLAATAGYSTGEGFRLDASWTDKNLFQPEGSLTVAGTGGTQQQGLSVTFRRANAGRRDKTVLFAITATRQDFDAYRALTAGIDGRISLDSTPIWQKRWTWAYGFEALGTRENAFQPALGARANQNYAILGVNGQVGFDSSNSLLDPTKGFRALVRISPETEQTLGRNYRYVRAQLDGSTYYPVSDSLTLAARARVASIVGAPRDAIAPSRRLYAGGGGSVRGFGYQQLGPRDINGDPVGARSLVEGAIEARYRFGNYGIVPFLDLGQAYESSTPGFKDLRYGVGIGGRFYTNFGPIRFDVATPVARRPGESKVAIYISIGQAF